MPFLLSPPFGTDSISPTLYLQAPPPPPLAHSLQYLSPAFDVLPVSSSLPFLVPLPISIPLYLSLPSSLPPSNRRRPTVCALNLAVHIFCSAHPSLPFPWSSHPPRLRSTAASPVEFRDDVGANSRSMGSSAATRPAALRPRGPNAAVMRLAASFSNFDDVVSPLPTGRGASQFPTGKRASSRLIFSGKDTVQKSPEVELTATYAQQHSSGCRKGRVLLP